MRETAIIVLVTALYSSLQGPDCRYTERSVVPIQLTERLPYAIGRYRADTGAPPASLNRLVPDYLKASHLLDPWHNPIRYRLRPGGVDSRRPAACNPAMSRLLVSVRSAAEAAAALEGGADVIDVKEPSRGPLGRADLGVLRDVIAAVAGRAPVSAALGELVEWGGRDPAEYPLPEGTAFVKVGLSACDRRDWKKLLADLRTRVEAHASAPLQLPKWIAVAYADQAWARSPAPLEVLRFAEAAGFAGLLLDTWEKNENRLTDWIIREELERLVAQTQWAGMTIALAGSLRDDEIRSLADLKPDLFAVRGAVCRGRERDGQVEAAAVRRLKEAAARQR